MRLRNRDGTAVDAVPFLVVASLAVLVCFSVGPIYLLTLGLEGSAVFGLPTVACAAAVGVAYHCLVYTAHPERRAEVPAGQRIQGLFYAALVGAAVLVALSLPLLVR
jgi:uncharacterized membrane protein SpoIIM required for sporulation